MITRLILAFHKVWLSEIARIMVLFPTNNFILLGLHDQRLASHRFTYYLSAGTECRKCMLDCLGFSYEKECKKDWEYHETCISSVPSLWTTRYFILLQNVRYSKRPKSRWVHNVLSIFWSTENCILDHLQSISAIMVLKLQWCEVEKMMTF